MMLVEHKLLIVDDDPNITRLLRYIFEKDGYTVHTLNQPTQTMMALVQHGFRVVISDIDMPELDGLELMRHITQYDASIQVVFITGRHSLSAVAEAFVLGAEYLAFKPLTDMKPLLAAISRCFEKLEHWANLLESLREKNIPAAESPVPIRETIVVK